MNRYDVINRGYMCSFLIQRRDIIVEKRTYQPYTLVGPLVWQQVLDPLAAYTSTTIYVCKHIWVILTYCVQYSWTCSSPVMFNEFPNFNPIRLRGTMYLDGSWWQQLTFRLVSWFLMKIQSWLDHVSCQNRFALAVTRNSKDPKRWCLVQGTVLTPIPDTQRSESPKYQPFPCMVFRCL